MGFTPILQSKQAKNSVLVAVLPGTMSFYATKLSKTLIKVAKAKSDSIQFVSSVVTGAC